VEETSTIVTWASSTFTLLQNKVLYAILLPPRLLLAGARRMPRSATPPGLRSIVSIVGDGIVLRLTAHGRRSGKGVLQGCNQVAVVQRRVVTG
jgi:hypothetical protein